MQATEKHQVLALCNVLILMDLRRPARWCVAAV